MPNSFTVTATTFLRAFSTANNNSEEDGTDLYENNNDNEKFLLGATTGSFYLGLTWPFR